MIAAHPDDENTALLAYLTRGRNVRTGYLSMTRGEGGQNLIGPEQGFELGVIRTQELLAARRIDGAEQFFTSAVDFGFSKTAEETLRIWGREKALNEVLQTIRTFHPDVIILRFSGTPRDGHGHHQSSAILAKEAYAKLAGETWKPKRVMWNLFSFTTQLDNEAAKTPARIAVDTGEYDPVLGFSYAEIAGMSRSMHRSQGFGAAERKGSQMAYLVTVAGDPAMKDIFDGVDTTWNRVAGGAGVGTLLARAIAEFKPARPEAILPLLLEARAAAQKLDDAIARRKLAEFDEAIRLCSGLWLDATVASPVAVEGAPLKLDATALNRSNMDVLWEGKPLAANTPAHRALDVSAQSGLKTVFRIRLGGQELEYTQPVLYRWVDPVRGELTRPLSVLPPVAVHVPEAALLFPSLEARDVEVRITANGAGATGELRLELPQGWTSQPAVRPFRMAAAGEHAALRFRILPPAVNAGGTLKAVAKLSDGREISTGVKVIDYPHIPAQTLFPPARVALVRANVRTLAKSVGYVMGAGDEMPQALEQMGCTVTLLADDELERGDLARFDAIVTGVRAYDVRPALRTNSTRLLEYVNKGGTLLVQYNKLESERGRNSDFAWGPYPFQIANGRVTVEDAPVERTDLQSRLLRVPNEIVAGDFNGWVQERGLYFASQWDSHYQTLLSSHDPGEPALTGSTLYAPYGKGAFVFTAMSWFRQLPAGVPGAYRIFANLLSAGKVAHE